MTRKEFLEIKEMSKDEAIREVINFCNDNDLEEQVDSFIDTDYLDELVKSRMDSGGWQGVACMLSDINYLNDDYYYLDGYGNMREVTKDDIESVIDEIVGYSEDLFEEDEEDEE